jgi:hypothetical protein
MFGLLRRLFARPAPPPTRDDPDFGRITYWRGGDGHGYWSMQEEWVVDWQPETLACPGIPGDENGPTPAARAFLLAKRAQHEAIWKMAEPAVRRLIEDWPGFEGCEPRQAFFISSLSLDADGAGWEACFDSRPPLKWINFCLQAEGDEWVTNTIAT